MAGECLSHKNTGKAAAFGKLDMHDLAASPPLATSTRVSARVTSLVQVDLQDYQPAVTAPPASKAFALS